MDRGLKAFSSRFIGFVVATTAVSILGDDEISFLDVTSEESEVVASVPVEGGPDAMTIGGLTGGAVALSVWLSTSHRTA